MKAPTQRRLRQLHQYLGVFFAPMILLFAVSGALQTYRLQEEKGYGGTPPSWIVWLASIHKDQSPPRDAGPPHADTAHQDDAPKPAFAKVAAAKRPSTLPLKIFVTLLALSLIASTLMGVIIALNNRVARKTVIVLLGLGTILPIVLLKL